MTAVFRFDELTWPEVAALPRSLPLVLPLGVGYDSEQIASALNTRDRIGLLPAIPFGWPGSALETPRVVFEALLANLLAGLTEDGFERIYTLAPPGLEFGLPCPQIQLAGGTSTGLPPGAHAGQVILAAAGQTEQHGYHLPLSTDTVLIDAVCQGAAQASNSKASALPVFPYGVSMHRRSFAGTFSCGGRAFEDFWLAVIDTLVSKGFEKIYLLSGHGGNCSFFTNVVKYAGERYPRAFCATAWLYLSGPRGTAALENLRESPLGGMGHACELETSLLLYLRPDLARMDRVVDEVSFITTPSYFMDWIEGGALVANPPWEDDTATGSYGAGSLGRAEKGQAWLRAAVEEKCEHIDEILEQYERRLTQKKTY